MVDEEKQLKAILRALTTDKEMTNLSQYMTGMSYEVKRSELGESIVYPYYENRLDFIKEYFHFNIQQCQQQYTDKKMKRLKMKLEEGNRVFIRVYDKKNHSLQDFCYEEIQDVRKKWVFFWEVQLSDGKTLSQLKLYRRSKNAFRKYGDWSVFEDLNFKMPSAKTLEDPQQLYLKRWKGRMWCIAANKARKGMRTEEELRISEPFVEQRKRVYELLEKNEHFLPKFGEMLDACMKQYSKKRISWAELYQCFDTEYQLLEQLEA